MFSFLCYSDKELYAVFVNKFILKPVGVMKTLVLLKK